MICRLCLEESNKSFEIISDHGETEIAKIITKYFHIEVKANDVYTKLCADCWQHLFDFHRFWLHVDEKQKTFQTHLVCTQIKQGTEDGEVGYSSNAHIDSKNIELHENEHDMVNEQPMVFAEQMEHAAIEIKNDNTSIDGDSFAPPLHSSGKEECIRKKYNKNSVQDRGRLLTAASRGEDWVGLASSLGVNYKTAHRWITSGIQTMKSRGGTKNKKLSDDHVNAILSWLESDCTLTLKQMSEKLQRDFNIVVSKTTIGNHLEGRMYSLKKVHTLPASMNTIANKEKRASYVRKLNQAIREGKQIAWIDETNFNLFCRMSRGRSRIGQRAVQMLPAARGPNVHLIGGITTTGVLLMERRRGSFTAEACGEWIEKLIERWHNMGNSVRDLVIVCDNAPCHSSIEEHSGGEATILRLDPYSPMLNPIETIWAKIKMNVRANLNVPNIHPPGVSEQRLEFLETVIDNAKTTITGGDCARAIQHTTTFHGDALAMSDMPVGF